MRDARIITAFVTGHDEEWQRGINGVRINRVRYSFCGLLFPLRQPILEATYQSQTEIRSRPLNSLPCPQLQSVSNG